MFLKKQKRSRGINSYQLIMSCQPCWTRRCNGQRCSQDTNHETRVFPFPLTKNPETVSSVFLSTQLLHACPLPLTNLSACISAVSRKHWRSFVKTCNRFECCLNQLGIDYFSQIDNIFHSKHMHTHTKSKHVVLIILWWYQLQKEQPQLTQGWGWQKHLESVRAWIQYAYTDVRVCASGCVHKCTPVCLQFGPTHCPVRGLCS